MPITGVGVGAAAAGGIEYVDRGDPAAWDYSQVTLTLDSAWHDLALGAIVGNTAVVIHVLITMKDNVVGSWFYLRKNGNVNGYNMSKLRQQVANNYWDADLLVSCDANQTIEYMGVAGIDELYLLVKGWLQPA